MLFGLQVDVSNKYVKIVDNPFKITNVTLGPKCQKGEKVTLMLQQGHDDAYALCTLESGSINQYQMNLSFEIGEEITFYLDSDKLSDKVHLTGMYLGEEIPSDFDFDEEDEDDEDDDSEIDYFDDEEEHSDLEDDEEICDFPGNKAVQMKEVEEFSTSDSEEELSAEEMSQEQRKPQAPSSKKPKQQAKQQQQQQQSDEGKKGKKREPESAQPVNNKKQKPDGQEQKTKGEGEEDSSKLKKFPNGLVVQEVSKGKGALIKEGSRVGIYYTGKLQNGKVFDSKTSGKPLMFTVGKKHVIPGMEQGIVGMNYGGKRVITIPPQLGYGKQSQPGIPSNSTLIFEITALESK